MAMGAIEVARHLGIRMPAQLSMMVQRCQFALAAPPLTRSPADAADWEDGAIVIGILSGGENAETLSR
jgi:hypothetical protein